MAAQPRPSEPGLEQALHALEAELGEPLLYRSPGQFLAASGLGAVPLGSWGLIALTPTRLVFHHFAQAHPLFGGRDAESRFAVDRQRFTACQVRREAFWARLFSNTPDHVALTAAGVWLNLAVADDLESFARAWKSS